MLPTLFKIKIKGEAALVFCLEDYRWIEIGNAKNTEEFMFLMEELDKQKRYALLSNGSDTEYFISYR